MPTFTYIIFTLLTICSVNAEFHARDAIFDGFVHGAVMNVVHEPIQKSINPTVVPYYVCTESNITSNMEILTNQEKCYTNILDYTIIVPPNPIIVFLANLVTIICLISFIIWCFTSTAEDKMELIAYICCHIIGQIIYDMLYGDDDD